MWKLSYMCRYKVIKSPFHQYYYGRYPIEIREISNWSDHQFWKKSLCYKPCKLYFCTRLHVKHEIYLIKRSIQNYPSIYALFNTPIKIFKQKIDLYDFYWIVPTMIWWVRIVLLFTPYDSIHLHILSWVDSVYR